MDASTEVFIHYSGALHSVLLYLADRGGYHGLLMMYVLCLWSVDSDFKAQIIWVNVHSGHSLRVSCVWLSSSPFGVHHDGIVLFDSSRHLAAGITPRVSKQIWRTTVWCASHRSYRVLRQTRRTTRSCVIASSRKIAQT